MGREMETVAAYRGWRIFEAVSPVVVAISTHEPAPHHQPPTAATFAKTLQNAKGPVIRWDELDLRKTEGEDEQIAAIKKWGGCGTSRSRPTDSVVEWIVGLMI
jgi:hypothetical protein